MLSLSVAVTKKGTSPIPIQIPEKRIENHHSEHSPREEDEKRAKPRNSSVQKQVQIWLQRRSNAALVLRDHRPKLLVHVPVHNTEGCAACKCMREFFSEWKTATVSWRQDKTASCHRILYQIDDEYLEYKSIVEAHGQRDSDDDDDDEEEEEQEEEATPAEDEQDSGSDEDVEDAEIDEECNLIKIVTLTDEKAGGSDNKATDQKTFHKNEQKYGKEKATKMLAKMMERRAKNPPGVSRIRKLLKSTFETHAFTPLAHQEELVRRDATKYKSQLLYWGMGSGKTKGAIYWLEHWHSMIGENPVLVVCSNSLIESWARTFLYMKQSPTSHSATIMEVVGYSEFIRLCGRDTEYAKDRVVIVDEAHFFRNLTARMILPIAAINRSRTTLLLTGTPVCNDPMEIVPLSLLMKRAEEKEIVETTRRLSEEKAFDMNPWHKAFEGQVSYYHPSEDPNLKKFFPEVQHHLVRVPMSWPQTMHYLMNLTQKVQLGEVVFCTGRKNSYNSLVKSICNTMLSSDFVKKVGSKNPIFVNYNAVTAPKMKQLVKNVFAIDKFPQVIVSQLLDNGVDALKKMLEAEIKEQKIPAPSGASGKWRIEMVTGKTPALSRQHVVDQYGKGKIHILFITNAAREGLDLMGTAALHKLDVHPNVQAENQAENRVVRFKSHVSSPYKQVHIYKYLATLPDCKMPVSDETEALTEELFMHMYKIPTSGGSSTRSSIRKYIGVRLLVALQQKVQSISGSVDETMEQHNQHKHQQIHLTLLKLKDCDPARVANQKKAAATPRMEAMQQLLKKAPQLPLDLRSFRAKPGTVVADEEEEEEEEEDVVSSSESESDAD